jgi:hypothetical protein
MSFSFRYENREKISESSWGMHGAGRSRRVLRRVLIGLGCSQVMFLKIANQNDQSEDANVAATSTRLNVIS